MIPPDAAVPARALPVVVALAPEAATTASVPLPASSASPFASAQPPPAVDLFSLQPSRSVPQHRSRLLALQPPSSAASQPTLAAPAAIIAAPASIAAAATFLDLPFSPSPVAPA